MSQCSPSITPRSSRSPSRSTAPSARSSSPSAGGSAHSSRHRRRRNPGGRVGWPAPSSGHGVAMMDTRANRRNSGDSTRSRTLRESPCHVRESRFHAGGALSPTGLGPSPTGLALCPTGLALSPTSLALCPTSLALSPTSLALSPTSLALSPTSQKLCRRRLAAQRGDAGSPLTPVICGPRRWQCREGGFRDRTRAAPAPGPIPARRVPGREDRGAPACTNRLAGSGAIPPARLARESLLACAPAGIPSRASRSHRAQPFDRRRRPRRADSPDAPMSRKTPPISSASQMPCSPPP